jgi:hypothetical protein
MSEKPGSERKDVIENLGVGRSVSRGLSMKAWAADSFAEDWFNDACKEAGVKSDANARRREIIFAVCCAEAYIVEWVRDEVLKCDFERLNEYFPPGEGTKVIEKWRDIPKKLVENQLITCSPNLSQGEGQKIWNDFQNLVKYRNGLIHARASRPDTDSQSKEEQPIPRAHFLRNELEAGWATGVVCRLAKHLHDVTGTSVPKWLVWD